MSHPAGPPARLKRPPEPPVGDPEPPFSHPQGPLWHPMGPLAAEGALLTARRGPLTHPVGILGRLKRLSEPPDGAPWAALRATQGAHRAAQAASIR